ncbi:FHA domain-containing protein [Kandleria sp.]|uniref:FHA domain-containing protein n=1 Tax=Kandleria sp. TaxID=2774291 RepID=UPI001B565E87|nr:FHA domain-containing protein [Kandleria sp.]MBP3276612.1 FHA domain-containing protein [Kandleria sp.]
MMSGKKSNILILIENGQLRSYSLDDKNVWEIGRPSKGNYPDIKLHSYTVSRKHGKFQNMDGVWFYIDYYGKNGTFYNHKHIDKGLRGRIKPVMLNDGDVFVFGGGNKEVINGKTVWGLYTQKSIDGCWKIVDSKAINRMCFITQNNKIELLNPVKGTVINQENGIAIYMNELTYMIGDMNIEIN